MPETYLHDLIPRNGFLWVNEPRILRSDARDAIVVDSFFAIMKPIRPRRGTVRPVLVALFDDLTASIAGIRGGLNAATAAAGGDFEDVVSWLIRRREEARSEMASNGRSNLALAAALPQELWLDFVYRVVKAHRDWEVKTPEEIKAQSAGTLPDVYFAVERFRVAAQAVWERDGELLAATVDPESVVQDIEADMAAAMDLGYMDDIIDVSDMQDEDGDVDMGDA